MKRLSLQHLASVAPLPSVSRRLYGCALFPDILVKINGSTRSAENLQTCGPKRCRETMFGGMSGTYMSLGVRLLLNSRDSVVPMSNSGWLVGQTRQQGTRFISRNCSDARRPLCVLIL